MRYDLTNWLIHFVRDRKPDQDFLGRTEEEQNFYAGGELEPDAKAFNVLQAIIRLSGLLPGYSFRNGRTTIYGGFPAVCSTEMPIYSFAKYVQERNSTDKVSSYGIAFQKNEFYNAGGRPVIYGLANKEYEYEINDPDRRIFTSKTLPIEEQFRYVAYNPSDEEWLDWSHEREWRWIPNNRDKHRVWCRDGSDQYGLIPGLPLFNGKDDGGYFSRLAIIVWTVDEAIKIQEMLTGFYLAGLNNYGTPFSRNVLSHSFIIILNEVVEAVESGKYIQAQTIEGLRESELYKPILLCSDSIRYEGLVTEAIETAKSAAMEAANRFIKYRNIEKGSCGFSNVVSTNVTNPIIQQLIKMSIASGPYDGRAILHIDGNWPKRQIIDYEECIAEAMCGVLNRYFGDIFYTESRLD